MKQWSMGFLTLALLAHGTSFAQTVETVSIATPRGAEINVIIDAPGDRPGRPGAVILAPGQGYHMDLPIMKELAEQLASRGLFAFRFNWNYFSDPQSTRQPSSGLAAEMEDMQAVVDLARSDDRIDPDRIVIGGKSLGSAVAYRVFRQNEDARALVLLTPLCSAATDQNGNPLTPPLATGAMNYPALTEVAQPVVVALGAVDPLCGLPQLYDWLKDSQGNVSIVTVGGDHSLNVSGGSDDGSTQRNARNISESVRTMAHWIDLILER